jgi:hypothetical protein
VQPAGSAIPFAARRSNPSALTIGSIRERTMSESLIARCSRYGLGADLLRGDDREDRRRCRNTQIRVSESR